MARGLPALQALKSVARRNREIVEASRPIEELEFPLNGTPEIPWNLSRGTRVPVAKQVNRRLVAEGLNHDGFPYYTVSV